MQINNRTMSPGEYIKYLVEHKIKITMPEDNRKYYGQQCQDERLNYKFRQLHKHLVNEVIEFCKSHNIVIDEFHLNADNLEESIKYGEWQACTDSCLIFDKFSEDYKKAFWSCDKEFIEGKTKQDLDKIELSQEPYLRSM